MVINNGFASFLLSLFRAKSREFLPLRRIQYSPSPPIPELDFWVHPEDDHYLAFKSGDFNRWEEDVLKKFVELARKSNIFLDIGGYGGIYSVIAAKVNANLQIFTAEPNKHMIPILRENLGCENNIEILQFGFSEVCGEAWLVSPRNRRFSSASFVEELNEYINCMYYSKQRIILHSLDCSFLPSKIRDVDLIKVDAEGFETQIICGGTNLLKQKPNLLIESNSNILKVELISLLKTFGYRSFDNFTTDRMFLAY